MSSNSTTATIPDNESGRRPKSLAKACMSCRSKKIRCNTARPRCSNCEIASRECIYREETPRKRPTFSQIAKLQRERAALKEFIVTLKNSTPQERDRLLISAVDSDGNISLLDPTEDIPVEDVVDQRHSQGPASTPDIPSDDELDIAQFISVDDTGRTNIFGPSSALHNPARSETHNPSVHHSTTLENVKNGLIANAALQRHLEYRLAKISTIAGEPTALALHLLNLHWARQHHTFLLTYRPAVMRDLACSGQYCSTFMLNAIFACCSKFSAHPEVRDDPSDPTSAGRRFFVRCDDLVKDGLLIRPHITTIVGLVLLGSTYNARGETSKGWLYTGYAIRMVYDLGLHLDPKKTTENPEEIEIRRRVFWGTFVCDKLQSLYMGRPVAINLRDSQVSREFLDLYEETEPFLPSTLITGSPCPPCPPLTVEGTIPIHSVSTFQQLCLLSKIMTTIVNCFYVVGATFSNAQSSLAKIEQALQQWRDMLPSELDFQPWLALSETGQRQTPNIMVLHNLYHSLIILAHRPFISDGHICSTTTPGRSWEQCTIAARCITSIASVYRSTYGLSGAPYVLAYTVYVACTIHVRNAASRHEPGDHMSLLKSSLQCLDELCIANPGVIKPAKSIRRLIEANKLNLGTDEASTEHEISADLNNNTFPDSIPTLSSDFRMDDIDFSLPLDPLFGWINVATPALYGESI
ncbi:fungal-specific transcription factor domain-containing protein [Fusarium tricinctum]|uniref:Fungal-specific transcription factor domain-containing protein n=1 Tax=Fusarium tricinctum TaxID=61284 RepID=A0A8K0RXS9_9HYPO|nr:fungal-specific transcription factor domain-containing protein [Fusarium tricinctum]